METIRQQLTRIRDIRDYQTGERRYYNVRRQGDQIVGAISGTPSRYNAQTNSGGTVIIEDAVSPAQYELRICTSNPANSHVRQHATFSDAIRATRQYVEYDWRLYRNGDLIKSHNRRNRAC